MQAGLIDAVQVQSALGYQRHWGCPLVQAVVELGFVAEPALMTEIARHLGVPYREIGNRSVPPETVRLLPEKLIRLRKVFPLELTSQSRRGPLVLATADPRNLAVLDEVAFATGKTVEPVLTSERDIDHAIERHLGAAAQQHPASSSSATLPSPVRAPGDPRRAA